MKKEIIFSEEDFEPFFTETGIDFESISSREWNAFENMFIEGTHWAEIAEVAAGEIENDRRHRNGF